VAESNHILVVEDEKRIRSLLADLLEDYVLTFARDQRDAWAQLHVGEFDLVLLDLKLPRDTEDMAAERRVGLDVLRVIRQSHTMEKTHRHRVPVIAMTAYGDEDVVAEMYSEFGLSFYIRKPFGRGRELENKIERALKGEGAGLPCSATDPVAVAIRPRPRRAQIGGYFCTDSEYDLIARLASEWPDGDGIDSRTLARELGVSDENFRKRVQRLRDRIKNHYAEKGYELDTQDILESRSWHGFRLSRDNVHVTNFGDLASTPET